MKNISSLKTSPQGLQPVSELVEQLQENSHKDAALLELRTEGGPVYLRPSGWQRFWLRRAFRHFHVLPPQLLSSRNQRRVTELLATSVVTPEKPVPGSEVFGVIAQVHGKSPIAVSTALKAAVAPAKSMALVTKVTPPTEPKPRVHLEPRVSLVKPAGFVVQDDGLWHWIAAAAAAAVCIPVIMASVYGVSLLSSPPRVGNHAASAPVQQTAAQATPVAAVPAPLPVPEKRHHRLALAQPALMQASATPELASAVPERRFVSNLPPGHFAYPIVTTEGLAGEVRLKATIGADGSVKQVTVLSGNPKLAEAAIRAVRRWHYSPNGEPMASETEIKMKFFGPDAVSIASVAGPAS